MRAAWIGVRMSDEEARHLRTVAEGEDRSMSWVLRRALSEYLHRRGAALGVQRTERAGGVSGSPQPRRRSCPENGDPEECM